VNEFWRKDRSDIPHVSSAHHRRVALIAIQLHHLIDSLIASTDRLIHHANV
jgi:hypothetical protein